MRRLPTEGGSRIERRIRRVAAALAFATVLVAAAGSTASAQITVGIIGDQTDTTDLNQAYVVLKQGVAALQDRSLDVVLHVGDLVESTQTDAEIRARFAQATALLNTLPAPWYLTAGDHDVNPPVFQQDSTDRSRETLFKQLYGAINPLAAQNLYYSVDVKNYHIVVLYSLEHLDTDPRWGNVFYAQISDQQFAWLEQDLADNTPGKAGTIVLLHQPLWYNWKGWARVHALLARYKVNTVVAGHFHYNQTQVLLDGIDYRVVGSTGGTTKQGNPNSGDLHHVTVMTLGSGGPPSFTMIPLAPYSQTTWTSRPMMDRVQALDQNLGNIYSFAGNSPVYAQNGALVAACGSTAPAQLVLKEIGNAAAVPVNVTITVSSTPAVQVTGASFGAGLCQSDIDEFECQLAPSAGVAVSNTSLIQMSQYPPPPPLWTATIAAQGAVPPVGTDITLTVAQSFIAGNQTYLVYQTGTTKVQGCN